MVKPLKIQKSMFCDEGRELTRNEYIRLIHTAEKGKRMAVPRHSDYLRNRNSGIEAKVYNGGQSGTAKISSKGRRRHCVHDRKAVPPENQSLSGILGGNFG